MASRRESRDRAHADWASRHEGVDPAGSAWVSGWARLTHACARPLARRGTSPDTVTLAGVAVTALVPLLAAVGSGWPALAVVVLVVGAVLDGVDGAVASQTGRVSAWGRVVDPLADRCSDLLIVWALVLLGAPGWLGVLLGVATLLLESTRAAAQVAGMSGPGRVTWWERPSRVIVVAFGLAACAALSWARPGLVDDAATVAAAVGLALALLGSAQLLVAVRRALA